jgi:hypothetical protein
LLSAPLMTATFCLCAMCDTNSSLHGSIATSLKVASLLRHLCSMSDTN